MGEEQKLTKIAIKVDLDCYKCRKKIKKVLCKIPHVQDQVYDEKANLVTITVSCCSPEKVMEKICCKGGDSVKGIEIVKPPPPKPKKPVTEPLIVKPPPPPVEKTPKAPTEDEKKRRPKMPEPAPMWYRYSEYYEECGGVGPPCPPPCYEGYGRPVGGDWGGGGCRGGGCCAGGRQCSCDDNPPGCLSM